MKNILFFLFLQVSYLHAQKSVNSAGGNGNGAGGSFSYSVGQIDYVSATGSNGSISQGVQQPLEVFLLSSIENSASSINLSVYPNPTSNVLFLKHENQNLEISYQIFDLTGKQVMASLNVSNLNVINIASLAKGVYVLTILANNSITKTFKIIKL